MIDIHCNWKLLHSTELCDFLCRSSVWNSQRAEIWLSHICLGLRIVFLNVCFLHTTFRVCVWYSQDQALYLFQMWKMPSSTSIIMSTQPSSSWSHTASVFHVELTVLSHFSPARLLIQYWKNFCSRSLIWLHYSAACLLPPSSEYRCHQCCCTQLLWMCWSTTTSQ